MAVKGTSTQRTRRGEATDSQITVWMIARVAGLIVVALFLWACCLSFSPADWPSTSVWPHPDSTQNWCGRVGALVAYGLFYFLGDGAWIATFFLTVVAGILLVRGQVRDVLMRLIGASLLVAVTATASSLLHPGGMHTLPIGSGGVLGVALSTLLTHYFSSFGTALILGCTFLVGLLLAVDELITAMPKAASWAIHGTQTAVAVAGGRFGGVVDSVRGLSSSTAVADRPKRSRTSSSATEQKQSSDPEGMADDGQEDDYEQPEADDEEDAEYEYEYEYEDEEDDEQEYEDDSEQAESDEEDDIFDGPPEDGVATGLTAPVVHAMPLLNPQQRSVPAGAWPRKLGDWSAPSLELLKEPEVVVDEQRESVVREKARVLEGTLKEFNIDANVVEIDTGPVITMFELGLAPGIRVAQISSRSTDIARALKAPSVRIVAPIPGKNTVGIEVPNLDKQMVRLRELFQVAGNVPDKMAIPLFLGKDASGNPLISDLTQMPHMLIAGTTGSGKSVCINTIIMSILMTQRPDHVKLIMIDPKMVEMSMYKEISHLMCPIVHDMNKAEAILDWLVTKMEERYALLAEAGVRNISAYNKLTQEELLERFQPSNEQEQAQIPHHLPYIVILIDELADLMLTSGKQVELYLSRLAQKSRAVGIHVILATQRPQANVVTGLIKSNLPARIAFRVASRMDSRIVLDQNGAEILLGEGDMLFLPPGTSKLTRAQGTYLSDSELRAVLNDLRSRAEPEYHHELMQLGRTDIDASGQRDPLFDDAVQVVLETKRGSVSLLQRRLTIGYSRASRLIEEMAMAGIVGEYKGSQAREVMITADQWEQMKAMMARDADDGYSDLAEDDDDGGVPNDIDLQDA